MTPKFNLLGSIVLITVLYCNLSFGGSVPIARNKYDDKLVDGDILPRVKRQTESNDVGLDFTVNEDNFLKKSIEEEKPMEDQAKDHAKEQQAQTKPLMYHLEKGIKEFFDTFKDQAAWQKYCTMNGVEEEWKRYYEYYYRNKYPDRDEPQIEYHQPGYLPVPVSKSQRNG